jgi:hypothetical protein
VTYWALATREGIIVVSGHASESFTIRFEEPSVSPPLDVEINVCVACPRAMGSVSTGFSFEVCLATPPERICPQTKNKFSSCG